MLERRVLHAVRSDDVQMARSLFGSSVPVAPCPHVRKARGPRRTAAARALPLNARRVGPGCRATRRSSPLTASTCQVQLVTRAAMLVYRQWRNDLRRWQRRAALRVPGWFVGPAGAARTQAGAAVAGLWLRVPVRSLA